MDPALHLANSVLLLSYAARDILWLRLLTVLGLGVLVGIEVREDPTVGPDLAWTLAFVALNAGHAAWLIWERRPVRLSPRDRALRELVFDGLGDRQFARLLELAQWEHLVEGTSLIHPGDDVDRIRLVEAGELAVVVGGNRVQTLGPGNFVGELGFLAGQRSAARVVACRDTAVLGWPVDALRTALEEDPHLRAVVQGCLGVDVALKLARSNAGAS